MSRESTPWLAVEGATDERLLRGKDFGQRIKIVVGAGWEGVVEILRDVAPCKGKKIVVGLIDRDYRDQNMSQPVIDGLVLSDYRDIECVMFWSSALQKVFCEHAAIGKLPKLADNEIDFSTVRDVIGSVSERLGKFRAYCFVSDLHVSFRGLDFPKFVCDRSMKFDHESFLQNLRGRNPTITQIDTTLWASSQKGTHLKTEYSSRQMICNGHDIMNLVALSLRRMWGSCGGKLSGHDLEASFRLAYEHIDLSSTEMWKRLNEALVGDECAHLT